jgi:hypothetical protein
MAASASITNAIILERTGREYGPDFMLKVEGTNIAAGNTITQTSSITEVLNIVGYLCNTMRDGTTINDEGSIDKTTYGNHDAQGNYTNNGGSALGAAGNTLYLSAGTALFNLNTLAAAAVANAFIPQGILRRTVDQQDPHAVSGPVNVSQQQTVTTLMSNCIKQMIHILEQTRAIFGPKGWTALFNQVKGGGAGAGSKHAKRTHRQHRRRYSSKQY